ncbi:MAG: TolC family protein [Gemmatimonadaceae bacterium]
MMRRYRPHSIAAVAAVLCTAAMFGAPFIAAAQYTAPPPDTLRLGELQSRAVQRDPRARQIEILAAQSSLRERDIDATRLPTLGANARAQYQSQVISIPLQLPNGGSLPEPSRDSYDAQITAQQPIYDPSVGARRGVERAQLAASQAGVRASLFTLRQNVNDAYFAALMSQMQVADQEAAITDIQAHRRVALQRVQQGAALPSEPDMLDAELLKRKQTVGSLDANRAAALAVLANLTGGPIDNTEALAIPDLAAPVQLARSSMDTLGARPEYAEFARNRDVIAEQQASLGAADLPRVSAFGRGGYGRPGLNPLSQNFQGYWLTGVKVDWTPWNWGTTRRDREALTLQKQIVETNEAAFRKSVQRSVTSQLATLDQLQQTLADDDAIITLRERVLRETEFRYDEGVITSADYIDRETDLLNARLARSTHLVQLAQARANFLTSLGLEVH